MINHKGIEGGNLEISEYPNSTLPTADNQSDVIEFGTRHCCVCDGGPCNHIGMILCEAHKTGKAKVL